MKSAGTTWTYWKRGWRGIVSSAAFQTTALSRIEARFEPERRDHPPPGHVDRADGADVHRAQRQLEQDAEEHEPGDDAPRRGAPGGRPGRELGDGHELVAGGVRALDDLGHGLGRLAAVVAVAAAVGVVQQQDATRPEAADRAPHDRLDARAWRCPRRPSSSPRPRSRGARVARATNGLRKPCGARKSRGARRLAERARRASARCARAAARRRPARRTSAARGRSRARRSRGPRRCIRRTSSGCASTWRPSTKNVARAPLSRSASSTGGVHSDDGPSSNVSASTRSFVPRPVTTRPKSGELGVNEAHAQISTSMQTRPKIAQPAQPASAEPTTSATRGAGGDRERRGADEAPEDRALPHPRAPLAGAAARRRAARAAPRRSTRRSA